MQENSYTREEDEDEIDILNLINVVFNRLPFIIFVTAIMLVFAIGYILVSTPIYSTSTKILVTPLKGSTSMEGMFNTNLTSTAKTSTEVDLIKTQNTLQRALDLMDLSKYNTGNSDTTPPLTAKDISGLITVDTKSDTRNTTITVQHSNPVFAADLANAVAQAYKDLLSNITKESTRAQMETIQNQIPIAEAQLSDSLATLSEFKSQNGTEQMANKIKVLTSKIAEIQLQRSPLELQKAEVVKKLGIEPDVSGYPSVQENIDSYSQSVKEYLLYKGVGDDDVNSSRLYALESQINTIKQDIVTKLSDITANPAYAKDLADYMCVVARMDVLGQIEQMYNAELSSYQKIEGRLQELEGTVSVNQSLLLSLKNMLEETRVVDSSEQSNVTIIDPATVPTKPISPKKTKILAVAILLGIVLSVGYVVLEQLLDQTVKSEDEVRRALRNQIPSLGWIPYVKDIEAGKNKSRVLLHSMTGHESFANERYRVLASNLEFVGNSKVKVMVINSADIGEGKTTITCNLATTLANNGRKVLVIDGDLRRPEMERSFDIARCNQGLTDVLINGVKYEDCIVRPVKNLDNLHLLPSGHSSRNPNIVFDSKAFANLIKELKQIYDYIFIDCPPVSYGSDFGIIAKNIDGYVFAIRAGYATREQVSNLLDVKNFIPSTLLGYVFYGALEDKSGYGYGYSYGYYGKYGYGYRYGKYGYGYGSEEETNKKDIKSRLKNGRFTLRRKVNYRKIRSQEADKRQKMSHIYGSTKAPLAYQNGIEMAFGNLDEVAIMKSTISNSAKEPKEKQ